MKGRCQARRALALAILACQQLAAVGLQDPSLKLSLPVLTNNHIELTLTCEAGVRYIIENTTNLLNWTQLITNADPEINRTFTLDYTDDATVYRARRYQLPVFAAAIATKRNIDLNGKTLKTDSFDSLDPFHSNFGLYPFGMLERTRANGDVVTDLSFTNSASATVQIKGTVRTGPTGSFPIGTNSSVGDRAWVESGTLGIQPGHLSNLMNIHYPTPKLPSATWITPIKGPYVFDGVTYDYVLSQGYYRMNALGSGSYKIYVNGDVALWVYSDISMSGTDTIYITNGLLTVYMSGATASFGGAGVVNTTGNALGFQYYGLASNTSVNCPINQSFAGCINAPTADVQIGAGGADTYHFIGGIVGKSFRLNGNFFFHFDEALKLAGAFYPSMSR